MKKIITSIICLLSISVHAEKAWISDALQTSVTDTPSVNGKFLSAINAGEPVELLGLSDDKRYAHIKTDKINGWVWARNVINEPSIQVKYAQQQQDLVQAQNQNAQLSNDSRITNATLAQLRHDLAVAQENAQKSRTELVALQRASANVVQIDSANRELQARVVALETENANLRRSNSRLEESASQKQMTIGGGLVIISFVLSWLFGLMRRNRRQHSFNDL